MDNKISINLKFGEKRGENEKYLTALKDGYDVVEEFFDPLSQGMIIRMEKKDGKM